MKPELQQLNLHQLSQTPIDAIKVNGFDFYLKRDDVLHPDFCGNKARKFYSLLQRDLSGFDKLVSYGSPQANSLHCLAVLAQLKQLTLDYYVDHIPTFMQQNPAGNYASALARGVNLVIADKAKRQAGMADFVQRQIGLSDKPGQSRCLYIPEGGSDEAAEPGIKLLAGEIIDWANTQGFTQLKVVLPSGTGTTAVFLQKHFRQSGYAFEVLTCACVGGDDYLISQMTALVADKRLHPKILPTKKKYHFGKLYPEAYQMWQQLKLQTDIEFELLYDPYGWLTLLDDVQGSGNATKTPILYIHQGGLKGNETMLPRYVRQYG